MVLVLFIGTTIIAQDKVAMTETTEAMEEISKKEMEQTNIVTYLASSDDYSTLVTAVQAAGLTETLSGKGPFTVFAPNNAAFEKLGKEALGDLLKAENISKLKSILTYHVIAGNADSIAITTAIENGGGKAEFKTISGKLLIASVKEGHVYLTDENGNFVKVTKTDAQQTNGVIHTIDDVVIPSSKGNY